MVAEFRVKGEHRSLPMPHKHTLFRTAQEGLTNVRRHARASRVDVILSYEGDTKVRLRIEDNGVGSVTEKLEDGFGLIGIQERVQLLGGKVRVESAPNEGFILEAILEI